MAEWSGFFDAHKMGDSWDRTYLAEDFAKFFAPLIGNGIFAGKSNELQVFQDVPASMSVVLSSGQSWIEGYGYVNDSDLKIPVDPADGALGRIDRIVNQWSAVDRQIRTVWKKGTPAVNPVAPPLLWNADYKELNICILDISAGLAAITQDKIKDTRADSSVCGWVTGLIDQVDTSTLFAQWEAAYEKEFTEQKRAWEEFFKDIQVDLGIPVPSPDKARYVLSVDSLGGYILSDEYASKEYANSRNPYNLLDNSDFRNPVNQRGSTIFQAPNIEYWLDRWVAYGTSSSFTLKEGKVVISSDGTATCGLMQRVSVNSLKAGSKYTLAFKAKVIGAKCYLSYGVKNKDNAASSAALEENVEKIHTFTFTLPEADADSACYNFRIRSSEAEATMEIEWAALYEGEYTAETLPEYQSKGYAAELMECYRYFYKLTNKTTSGLLTASGTELRFGVETPIAMRTTPTLSSFEMSGLRTIANTNIAPAVTDPLVGSVNGNVLALRGTVDLSEYIDSATNINNTPVAAYIGFELSADL